jgi:hypothetical protein
MARTKFAPAVVPFGPGKGYESKTILTDGKVFRCMDCDEEFDSYGAARSHRALHNSGRRGRKPKALPVDPVISVMEGMQALMEYIEQMRADFAAMEERALRAEKSLRAIRRKVDAA